MGHEREALDIANELDVEFISISNDPLGNKWNAGFMACMREPSCLVCRLRLCRARSDGLLRWPGVSCTSGTGVYPPVVRGVL